MADPTAVINSALSGIKRAISGTKVRTAIDTAVEELLNGKPVIGYPIDILQPTSEVNRAVQFSAYEYIWGSTVSNEEVLVKENNTHIFSCYLPIPPLSDSDSHSYNQFDAWGTGQIEGKDVKSAMSSAGASINAMRSGNGEEAMNQAGNALSSGVNVIAPVAIKGAVKMLQGAVGEDWNVLRRNAFNGITVNPLTTVIYQNSNLRTFNFSYTMIARDEAESRHIDQIIKSFKYYSRPKKNSLDFGKGVLGADISLETLSHPCIWNIRFIGEGTSGTPISFWLPKIKTCVLTSIGVSYGGAEDGSPLFFRSTGAPVQYNIDLSFQEMYINTADDITVE